MVRRLVLGFGPVGHALLDRLLADRGELVVLEADEGHVESLREENLPAQLADPTDPKLVAGAADAVDTLLVLGDDSATNRAAVEAAAQTHPEALLVAYTGTHPDPADRAAMSATADRLVDHGSAVADHLRQLLGTEPGSLVYGLRRTLRNIDGTLGIFSHDNPDPDAIASGVGLRELARAVGVEATVCYFGEISHQENRAFVNLLDLELNHHEAAGFDAETYDAYALVDHTRPGVNDQLPADLPIEIVIDHHPEREPVEVRFEDRRPELGATSTMIADYYRWLGMDPTETVATALLYGIRVDTRNFGRELTEPDMQAAGYLLERADTDLLEQVESPSMTADTFDTIARAITRRVRADSVVASCVRSIHDRDALAQAADELLELDDTATAMVFGFIDGTIYVSARSQGAEVDIGEVLRQAFGQIGSAGGHADMAGAQLPMGILGEVEAGEAAAEVEATLEETLIDRFFEVLGVEADDPAALDPPHAIRIPDRWDSTED